MNPSGMPKTIAKIIAAIASSIVAANLSRSSSVTARRLEVLVPKSPLPTRLT